MTCYTCVPSTIGTLLLTSDGAALTGLLMEPHRIEEGWVRSDDDAPVPEARRQLTAYFEGSLREFDLPLAPNGTAFQSRVWEELLRIPYGQTLSYGQLASRIGKPGAARAVGLANGRNPIAVIVPCHRVIGADGSATGYGGGLERKAVLLGIEGVTLRL